MFNNLVKLNFFFLFQSCLKLEFIIFLRKNTMNKFISKLFSTSKHFIQLQNKYGCHNYSPLPVAIDKAEGVFMWDCEGNKYYDFLSAYSAVNQGHCHPKIMKTFLQQAQKLTLTSRAVFNSKLGLIQQKLHNMFGYDKALMMNTGVQAGQSAIKLARRWGYEVKKIPHDSATVLFAKGNFWGRTLAACGSSDDPDRYRNFGPFNGLNFQLIDYGCINSLQHTLSSNPNIVAFMVEPIQGQKGVVIPPQGYLKKVKSALHKHNALLICDQIQTGLGRTGKMLCSDYENVRPDIILLGKALSGGFYPVSAVLCDHHIMDTIKPGQHGSTYGGNPLGVATAITALDVLIQQKMCENSARLGQIFKKNLTQIFHHGGHIRQVRGKGLFVGVEFNSDNYAYNFSKKLLHNGLIAKPTQKSILRFSPPLVMTQNQLNESCSIIQKTWRKMQ